MSIFAKNKKLKFYRCCSRIYFCINKIARKSSCVTARGVLPAADPVQWGIPGGSPPEG